MRRALLPSPAAWRRAAQRLLPVAQQRWPRLAPAKAQARSTLAGVVGAAVLVSAAVGGLLPARALAHGALLEQQIVPAIAVRAMYDTGEPMKTAQITVYAPNDPAKPWLTGKADPQGHFRFVPDPAIPGQWTIQAREAGHGALIYVTLGGEPAAPAAGATAHATAASAASGASSAHAATGTATPVATALPATSAQAHNPLQRWVMVACVVWGFIGTALFFARKPRPTR